MISALLKLILAFMMLTITSGCNLIPSRTKVYVAPGQFAEIAKPVMAKCWVTNKETKKRELRNIDAQAGWYVGRFKDEGK